MVITQTLGTDKAKKVKKPHGKNAIQEVINANIDISTAIEVEIATHLPKPKTTKQKNEARQLAILHALEKNDSFEADVITALNKLAKKTH